MKLHPRLSFIGTSGGIPLRLERRSRLEVHSQFNFGGSVVVKPVDKYYTSHWQDDEGSRISSEITAEMEGVLCHVLDV